MTMNGWHDLPNEKAFRSAVVELARAQGWTVYFAPDQPTNRYGGRGRAGFPDLIMYKDDRVVAFELKMYNADVTEEQHSWLKALRHHIPAYEMRYPSDIKKIKWILVDDWDEYVSLTEYESVRETLKDIDSEWGKDKDKDKEETK